MEVTTAAPIDAPPRRKSRGWLPLLTVLFCISYGLMTMLIIEQGATIESQRALIRELFRDSSELSAVKMKAQMEKRAQAKGLSNGQGTVTAPSVQTPSAQAQNQTPSSQGQASPQTGAQNQTVKPRRYPAPSRPASDQAEDRRALITI